jgi:glyoxylase-like metal-dependent hydrolase (beta-lactamase superfamily II)
MPIRVEENLVYLLPLQAGGYLLIDAGPDTFGAWDQMLARINARGLAATDVRAVLITHAHIDHAGLAARWAAAGAVILAGLTDIPALLAGREWNEARQAHRLETLRRHGATQELLDVIAASDTRRGFAWEPVPPTSVHPIEDGTRIPLANDEQLRVIAAPGHTPGNLVALAEGSGDLYAGDTLLPHQTPTPGIHFPAGPQGTIGPRWPSLPEFLRTVQRLRELGARRTLQGHGTPGANPARLAARFEEHHARRARRYRALLADESDTAFGLAERAFPHIGPLQLAQAMTEIIGHFDLLEAAGIAEEDVSDEVVRVRLVDVA